MGVFFPCLGLLRSKVIPDAIQGSVMNIFRAPLALQELDLHQFTSIYINL